jgi:hypothetical protein
MSHHFQVASKLRLFYRPTFHFEAWTGLPPTITIAHRLISQIYVGSSATSSQSFNPSLVLSLLLTVTTITCQCLAFMGLFVIGIRRNSYNNYLHGYKFALPPAYVPVLQCHHSPPLLSSWIVRQNLQVAYLVEGILNDLSY